MEESKPPRRMKGVTVCLPIVYGSIAWLMPKKPDDECTHQWALYVRSPHGHDLGAVLKSVVFGLHPSFINNIREVPAHPFEVTEKGWGEFEAGVSLNFKDAHEKSVEFRHQVKLFHGNSATAQPNNKKPVVHEYYDEVVFTDPTEEFYQCLQHLPETKTHRHTLQEHFPLYSDVEDVRKIQAAHEFITDQLRTAKDKLLRVEQDAKGILAPKQGPPPPAATAPPAPAVPTPAPAVAVVPTPAAAAAAAAPPQPQTTAPAPAPAAAPPAPTTTTTAAAPPAPPAPTAAAPQAAPVQAPGQAQAPSAPTPAVAAKPPTAASAPAAPAPPPTSQPQAQAPVAPVQPPAAGGGGGGAPPAPPK